MALAASVCLGASACGGKQEAEFGTADQQAIRQVTTALETSFNAKDVDKILSLYTDNSTFMPPNKPLLRGRGPLKGFYDGLMSGGAKDLKITPTDVAGHGPTRLRERLVLHDERNGCRSRQVPVHLPQHRRELEDRYTSWSSDLPPQ